MPNGTLAEKILLVLSQPSISHILLDRAKSQSSSHRSPLSIRDRSGWRESRGLAECGELRKSEGTGEVLHRPALLVVAW